MLIGREQEILALTGALESNRLVSIVGAGGVGKTSLARLVLSEYPRVEQAAFLDLTPAGGRLIEDIAGQLGFASFDRLISTVGSSEWLLVLDNCEHVLDAAAAVTESLLEKCPSLRIVATSREPLEIRGEHIVRLQPLSTEGRPSPAATMFVTRAAERGIDLAADDTIEEICVTLDGLPLAIELAAAKASAMTAVEILEAIENPLVTLTGGRRRGPERHRSLEAAIEWSYKALPEDDRVALEALSIFEGPFSRAMAAAAIGTDHPDPVLESLVERSLLVHEPVADVSWFRILETIKAYARQRASEHGTDALEGVVSDVVERLGAIAADPMMSGSRVPDLLDRGFPTTRRVLETMLDRGDRERSLLLVRSLWWLEDVGHQAEAAELIGRILDRWPDPTDDARVAYALGAGLERLAGRRDEAARLAAVATSEASGVGAAWGFRIRGQLERGLGRWDEARALFERGAEIAFTEGEEPLALEIWGHAALGLARSGDVASAVERLADLTERAEPYPLCRDWLRLFYAWTALTIDPAGSAAVARRVFESDGLHVANQWAMASAHLHLGMVELQSEDPLPAGVHLVESLERFLGIRNTTDVKLTLLACAALFNRIGRHDEAHIALASAERTGGLEHLGEHERELYRQVGLPDSPPPPSTRADPHQIVRSLRLLLAESTSSEARSAPAGNRFERSGEVWTIGFDGTSVHVGDSKGMADIARLLSQPGRDVPAIELVDAAVEAGPVDGSDARALGEYRARVRELRHDLDEAEAANDGERASGLRAELDALVEHISAAYGLGGKQRRSGSTEDRARSAVTWRIRAAIKRVAEVHPACGNHLDRSISTGRFCRYAPEAPTHWQL